MSKLYYTENGQIVTNLGEELTRFRRARKTLHIPGTTEPASLYIFARPYPGFGGPLHLSVNGVALPSVPSETPGIYAWYEIKLTPDLLLSGANTFDLWCDASVMNGWSLALEPGRANPQSFVSDDSGSNWRNEQMGYLNNLRGEYLLRLRLAEGDDPPPPDMVWEDAYNPRLASLRGLLPPETAQHLPLLQRVRSLTGWLSQSWAHQPAGTGTVYSPWDAETLLAWGNIRAGHNGRPPIAMCVHYGAAFVSACQAASIPARALAGTADLNGPEGHFLAEVWFEEYSKWVVVDPNLDIIFYDDNLPLSFEELRAAKDAAGRLARYGAGTLYQKQFPHIAAFLLSDTFQKGKWMQHRSLWPRADLLSQPQYCPSNHGATAYCETGFVWEEKDQSEGFGMFPYFGAPDYFTSPPQV